MRDCVLCGVRAEGKEKVNANNFQAPSASRCFRDNGYSDCDSVAYVWRKTFSVCVVYNATGHILDIRIVDVFSLHIFTNVESNHRMNAPDILRCADIS